MLITSRFVVLNVPKSGSSFVREVIKTIYAKRQGRKREQHPALRFITARLPDWRPYGDVTAREFLKELYVPRIRLRTSGVDQHGLAIQIPPRFRHLPVVSVARNPYDKFLSDYEFRWWAKSPPLPLRQLVEAFPHYPDLSLDEFAELCRLTAAWIMPGGNPRGFGICQPV